MKRLISTIMAVCLAFSCVAMTATAQTQTAETAAAQSGSVAAAEKDIDTSSKVSYVEYISYQEYCELHKNEPKGTEQVVITDKNLTKKSKSVELRKNYNGYNGTAIYTSENDSVEFTFNAKAGLYNLYIEYYTEDGKNVNIERSLSVNGEVPFSVAEDFAFTRSWQDELVTDKSGNTGFAVDIYGNSITPDQVEKFKWCASYFYDYLGYYSDPLLFSFKNGVNTITLDAVKEPMTIGCIKLMPATDIKTYEQYLAACQNSGYADYSGDEQIIEAEYATEKSDQTLYPSADVSTPSTSIRNGEISAYLMHINQTGGTNWQYPQQKITWTVDENAKPGMYAINLKVRKNQYQGMVSSRKLLVNNEVPFKEAEAISFTYSTDWTFVTPQTEKGEQCLVYLKPGDTIALEVTLGEMGALIRDAEEALSGVNAIYRSILMITGSAPDQFRDYKLDELIPDVVKQMNTYADRLDAIVSGIVAFTGQKGSELASLDTLSRQLRKMYNDPDCINKQLGYYKTNIGSFGNWLNTASYQPLEIDYISLSQPESTIKNANKGFFTGLFYEINRFIASFVVDYNAIGSLSKISDNNETVTVWIATGRDQFQTLRNLINNSYTASTGNQINLELVNAGALLSAVVAGIGPDVVLGQAKNEPVNFALRNAVYDLTNFKDLDEIKKRFSHEAIVPYYFNDGKHTGLYALPETQDFHMLFYRKDVLNELKLGIPNTWTDVISCITVLNKHNMEFGLPVNIMIFYSMLLQQGGRMYKEDNTATDLQTVEATKAFKQWTNFYVNYDCQLEFDFQNRFRTGEMPLGIASYTLYNTLAVSAPEIRGIWGFTSIPGTVKADGTIDRSNDLTCNACFILKDNRNYEKSWEFLKWWTSAATQSDYGNRLECILGASARYNTANVEAFESLPWSATEIAALNKQLETSYSLPEIAGSYFITRHINNAFRRVKYKSTDAKDTLFDYSKVIDAEITNKRSEFGLPIASTK